MWNPFCIFTFWLCLFGYLVDGFWWSSLGWVMLIMPLIWFIFGVCGRVLIIWVSNNLIIYALNTKFLKKRKWRNSFACSCSGWWMCAVHVNLLWVLTAVFGCWWFKETFFSAFFVYLFYCFAVGLRIFCSEHFGWLPFVLVFR